MSINLVDMAKGYLGRAVMEKIAGSLGGSTQQTESAIGAAIPSILGGLISKGSTREGAESLSFELDKHDSGFLDNIGDAIGGDGLGRIAGAGSGLLGGLLGDSKLGGMLDLISKVSGMGRSGSSSIVGLVTSVLMGILGKQKRSQGLDIGGIMGLLDGQKANVASGLPSGMGNILGLGDIGSWGSGVAGGIGDAVSGTVGAAGDAVGDAGRAVGGAVKGGVGAVGGAVSSGAGAVGDAGRAVGGAVGDAGRAVGGTVGDAGRAVGGAAGDAGRAVGGVARDTGAAAKSGGGGLAKLLIPLLLLALLGLALMRLLGACGGEKTIDVKAPDGVEMPALKMPAGVELPAGIDLNIPGIDGDLRNKSAGIFSELTGSLETVTDKASAENAVSGLGGLATKIGGLATGLAPEQKGPLGKLVGAFLPTLSSHVDRIRAIPGVGPVLDGVLNNLMAKVKGLIPA